MKLKFQIIDKSQTGFARYCPSFAKAYKRTYDCIADRITEIKLETIWKRHAEEDTNWANVSKVFVDAVKRDVRTDTILSILARRFRNPDETVRTNACITLKEMARTEKNMARIIAIFAKALDSEYPKVVEHALAILADFAENKADISPAMSKICEKIKPGQSAKIRSDATQLLALIAEKKTDADLTAAIPALTKRLRDWDAAPMDSAAIALARIAANNKKCQTQVLKILMDAADDPLAGVRLSAIKGLRVASEKMDTSIAIPVFAKALGEPDFDVVLDAVKALSLAMEHNPNISIAVPKLFDDMLFNMRMSRKDRLAERLTEAVVAVLKKAARMGDQETRKAIAIEINKIIRSDWFGQECAKYSELFIQLVNYCAGIMASARDTEANEIAEQT